MSSNEELRKQMEENEKIISEFDWLLRPCEIYKDEYKDCRAIKSRFHQYFIYGSTLDCTQWKRDFDNCCKWIDEKDDKAAIQLIESEKDKRTKRLSAHYNNNIWKRRDSPPEDWNKPLPDHVLKDYESTYLNIKSKELRGEIPPVIDTPDYCTIL